MVVFILISVVWAWMALAMITAPSWWREWLVRQMAQPLRRLLWGLGLMVAGLVLIVGSSGLEGDWLWVIVGAVVVGKGMLLVSLSESSRHTVEDWWRRRPVWADQIMGVASMALATLLAIDLIRVGR